MKSKELQRDNVFKHNPYAINIDKNLAHTTHHK